MKINKSKDENRLLFHIISQRNGHYCHAFELSSVYDFQCLIDSLIEQMLDSEYDRDFVTDDYISFFKSASLYYVPSEGNLTDEQKEVAEKELQNFNIADYVTKKFDG